MINHYLFNLVNFVLVIIIDHITLIQLLIIVVIAVNYCLYQIHLQIIALKVNLSFIEVITTLLLIIIEFADWNFIIIIFIAAQGFPIASSLQID